MIRLPSGARAPSASGERSSLTRASTSRYRAFRATISSRCSSNQSMNLTVLPIPRRSGRARPSGRGRGGRTATRRQWHHIHKRTGRRSVVGVVVVADRVAVAVGRRAADPPCRERLAGIEHAAVDDASTRGGVLDEPVDLCDELDRPLETKQDVVLALGAGPELPSPATDLKQLLDGHVLAWVYPSHRRGPTGQPMRSYTGTQGRGQIRRAHLGGRSGIQGPNPHGCHYVSKWPIGDLQDQHACGAPKRCFKGDLEVMSGSKDSHNAS